MTCKLKATFDLVFRELDNIESGCDLETSISNFLSDQSEHVVFHAENVEDLLIMVQKHFKVNEDALLLNSCEEIGRLDVQTYTKGTKGIKCQYDQYKTRFINNEVDLWLNTIVGQVETITSPVDLLK